VFLAQASLKPSVCGKKLVWNGHFCPLFLTFDFDLVLDFDFADTSSAANTSESAFGAA